MAANSRRRQEKVRCGAAVVIEINSTLESDNPIGASSQRHGPDPFDGPSTSRQDAAARQPSPMRLRRLRIIRARHDSSSSDTSQGSTTHPARRFGQVQVSNQISPVMVNGLPGWIIQTPGGLILEGLRTHVLPWLNQPRERDLCRF